MNYFDIIKKTLNEAINNEEYFADSVGYLGHISRVCLEMQLYCADKDNFLNSLAQKIPLVSDYTLKLMRKHFNFNDKEVAIINDYLSSEKKLVSTHEDISDDEIDNIMNQLIEKNNFKEQ